MRHADDKVKTLNSVVATGFKEFSIVVISAICLILSSKTKVPFIPVPFTLQTFAVVMISIFCGRKLALMSLLTFVALWSPMLITSGYVLGFFAVPFITGNGSKNLNNVSLCSRIFISHAIILLSGTLVLSHFIGVKNAFVSGFVFFIPSEILKGILSFLIVKGSRI